MTEKIEFETPDGSQATGFRAGSVKAPGVVVIQEWWGVNSQIHAVCERLAAAGFATLAPDLYAGKVVPYHDTIAAGEALEALDYERVVGQILVGAARRLAGGGKVGCIGFSLGGMLSVLAAAYVPAVSAAISFYGLPPVEHLSPDKVRVPLQGHFASRDQGITPRMVAEFAAGLEAARRPYEFYRYETDHAFLNEERSETYDRAAATLAWDRGLRFLREQLQD